MKETVEPVSLLVPEQSFLLSLTEAFSLNITDLLNDPGAWIQSVVFPDGHNYRRTQYLQSGAAMGVALYSLIAGVLVLGGFWQGEMRADRQDESGISTNYRVLYFPRMESGRMMVARSSENQAGLSAKRQHSGGGGSGSNELQPADAGNMPAMSPVPLIVLPSKRIVVIPAPTLTVQPHVNGPQYIPEPEALPGDPTSDVRSFSNGPGSGGSSGAGQGIGMGPGTGAGYGSGNHRGTGGGPDGPGGPGGDDGSGRQSQQARVTRSVQIIHRERASYTEEARSNRTQGTVVLSALFSADGTIRDIRVTRGLPDGLTERAIEAMKKMRFTPAVRGSQPVSVRMSVEFSFSIF